MKFIFVSGGVISGLGKGITASSIGRLLMSRGLNVSAIKIDPYLNIDAGTMNPFEHGEVYVLEDGGEADLDLGNYERFMGLKLTRDHNITTGKVYKSVIEKERHGDYLGKTVQIVPHITNEIKNRIMAVSRHTGADVVIVELGGTVGDIESMPFLEAVRQLGTEIGHENALYVHTTLIPVMGSVGEQKTKPTQHSVKELMGIGIRPDVIVGRSKEPLSMDIREKISMFCGVPVEAVVSSPDARSIYEVPIILEKQGIADYIIKRMNLTPYTTKRNMKDWEGFLKRVTEPSKEVTIALVGKYTKLADSYLSHIEAFTHAGAEADTKVHIKMIDSDDILKNGADTILGDVDGVLVPGGFGVRGVEGMIEATRYARENKVPFLGVCLGFQIATIGIARHVLGLKDANSTEFDESTKNPVIFMMGEQTTVEDKGATMRLGAQDVDVREGSVAYGLYDATKISERHRHRYEVNPAYIDRFEEAGWLFTGRSDSGRRMEIGELKDHPFFVASQFHPEFKSEPMKPTPLHLGLVKAAVQFMKSKRA
ncbi:MAG: CTP synthase (glutamine hydrolyzing) [Candidatus Methanomethylophilaceae archaeon]|nr:CTP synthase (glutamine hydrolyzing) [Candidatus Methanomethylophilaceae archaeon]